MKRGVVIFSDKKFLLLISSLFVLIVGVSIISANSRGFAMNGQNTIVEGKVYYSLDGSPASYAKVVVICDTIPYPVTYPTTCDEDGKYHVVINSADKCFDDRMILVTASRNGINGTGTGTVKSYSGNVDVILFNGNVVPEFGTVVGILTALGALGVFFIIRRK